MSQPALEGMPQRLYPAAPSRLTTYLDCPRRYRFGYLDRPPPRRGAPWGHNSVGASVHTALARWWSLPRLRRTPAAGGTLLVSCWLTDGFRDAAQMQAARRRSRAQVEAYLADVDPDAVPVGVERTVTIKTRRAGIWGRVDRIDDRPERGLVVVDYKTGGSSLSVEDARSSLALAVYAAATAATFRRDCTRVELHHLPSGEVLGWDHDEHSLGGHLARADSVAEELATLDESHAGLSAAEADDAFPARVAGRCGWCDFQPVCAPGRAVPRRAPWAGVPDD
ncbi:MAG TPA: PD-(D/E)XK nuclease family protein [Nocardioidaceae bacterium]|nr:PD-(D/E)XK nuclease family protein [Nocardioidaceae bacterium]